MVLMLIFMACLTQDNAHTAKSAAVGLLTYMASFSATWLPLP
jgi:hypothetical protein